MIPENLFPDTLFLILNVAAFALLGYMLALVVIRLVKYALAKYLVTKYFKNRGEGSVTLKPTPIDEISFRQLMKYLRNSGEESWTVTPIENETTQEETTEPVDTTDEGNVETPTDFDREDTADDTSATDIASGTTDSTE